MILVLVLSQIVASIAAVSLTPRAPSSVEVRGGLLRWSPSEENLTHTPQYMLFGEREWSDLRECKHTAASSCNISALIRDAPHGCVRLQVRAQRGNSQSNAVEACRTAEDHCTPTVSLSPVAGSAPGSASITVHLTRDHPLHESYADHAQHMVQYWLQDQPQKVTKRMSHVTLTLPDLDPGQTYCAQVQYYRYGPQGVPCCPVCVMIPQAPFKHAAVVMGVVIPGTVLLLGSAFFYVLIFHKNKVKNWLKPEPQPNCLTLPQEGATVLTVGEINCSLITGFTETDQD